MKPTSVLPDSPSILWTQPGKFTLMLRFFDASHRQLMEDAARHEGIHPNEDRVKGRVGALKQRKQWNIARSNEWQVPKLHQVSSGEPCRGRNHLFARIPGCPSMRNQDSKQLIKHAHKCAKCFWFFKNLRASLWHFNHLMDEYLAKQESCIKLVYLKQHEAQLEMAARLMWCQCWCGDLAALGCAQSCGHEDPHRRSR